VPPPLLAIEAWIRDEVEATLGLSPSCTLLPPCSSLDSPAAEALVTPSQESDAVGTPSVEATAANIVVWEKVEKVPEVAPEKMNERRKMALPGEGEPMGVVVADVEIEGVFEEDGVLEGVMEGVPRPSHSSPAPHTEAGLPHSTEPP